MATMRSNTGVRAVCPSPLTRISYQVGSPWMFDGNRFLPDTGTPMRKIACMMRPLALADPVPFVLAILKAKSLTRSTFAEFKSSSCRRPCRRFVRVAARLTRPRDDELELLHVPRARRAALGAQAAVHAEILVLY